MPIELKDWGIVFLHIFQFDIQLFHHSSVLFDGQVQFSSIPIGFSWYPCMETWLAVFEQPSADLERQLLLFVLKLFFENFTNEHYEAGRTTGSF